VHDPRGYLCSLVGVILFVGVLASQGLPAIMATLSSAGWGLLLVALFHLLPLGWMPWRFACCSTEPGRMPPRWGRC
jgi:hypothetical protein